MNVKAGDWQLSVLQAIKVTWLQNIHRHLLKEFNLKVYYLCFPHEDLEFFQLWSILKTHRDPKIWSLSDAGCRLVLCNVSGALTSNKPGEGCSRGTGARSYEVVMQRRQPLNLAGHMNSVTNAVQPQHRVHCWEVAGGCERVQTRVFTHNPSMP